MSISLSLIELCFPLEAGLGSKKRKALIYKKPLVGEGNYYDLNCIVDMLLHCYQLVHIPISSEHSEAHSFCKE